MNTRRIKPIRSIGDLADQDTPYRSRQHAGRLLAQLVTELAEPEVHLLAIWPGGIPVAAAISESHWLATDGIAVVPLCAPWRDAPPYGAIAFDGSAEVDAKRASEYGVGRNDLSSAVRSAFRQATARSAMLYGVDQAFPDLSGRVAVVVDDGMSDPITVRVAIAAVENAGAAWTVLALPTGRPRQMRELSRHADRVYCAHLCTDRERRLSAAYEQLAPLHGDEALADLLAALSPVGSPARAAAQWSR